MAGPRKQRRSNGEGGVRHDRRRNRWVGQVTLGWEPALDSRGVQIVADDGSLVFRQRRRSVVGKTKADVLARMREVVSALDRGVDLDRTDLTVAAYLEDWLERALPGTVRLSTQQQYRDVVRLYIVPRIGSKKLTKLSVRDVSAMLLDMAKPSPSRPQGYSSTARRLARSVLRRALRAAEAEGLVGRNVAALANAVKADVPEGRTLTPAQAQLFLRSIRGHRDEAASS